MPKLQNSSNATLPMTLKWLYGNCRKTNFRHGSSLRETECDYWSHLCSNFMKELIYLQQRTSAFLAFDMLDVKWFLQMGIFIIELNAFSDTKTCKNTEFQKGEKKAKISEKLIFYFLIFYPNDHLGTSSWGPDPKIGNRCFIQSCCWPEILLLLKTFHSCLLSERDLLPNSLLLSLSAVATEGTPVASLWICTVYSHI